MHVDAHFDTLISRTMHSSFVNTKQAFHHISNIQKFTYGWK